VLEDVHRALLVECINADQFPGQIAALLPVLKGWLRARGVSVRWLRYGVSSANLHRHGRDSVTLADGELNVLLRAAAELRPDTIVGTHPLFEEHVAALRGLVPGLRLVLLPELDVRVAWIHGGPDGVTPDYRFEPANVAAAQPDRQNVYVLAGDRCGYRAAVAANPCYAELDLPARVRPRGCAFCGTQMTDDAAPREATLDRITCQLRAIQADYPAAGRPLNALLFEDIGQAANLGHALAVLDELGMTDVPVLFGARTDRLRQAGDLLRGWLSARAGTGAALHVFVTGLENFSAAELLRMNKGTTPLDNLAAVDLLQELELRHPGTFACSGYAPFSVILFTPWTTFADLHLNLRLVQQLGIEAQVGNLFMARLRLHPDVAMTFLADRDGLLVDDVADPALRLNRRKLFFEERAWRFRDERLEPVNRIATRIEPEEGLAGDALYGQVQAVLAAAPPPDADCPGAERRHFVAFLLAVVDVARARAEVLDAEALLAAAAALWRARTAALAAVPAQGAGAADSLRFRVGEEALPFPAWLARVLPLVADGALPVLAVEGLAAADVADLDRGALRAAGLEHLLEAPRADTPGALLVGRERAAVARRLGLRRWLGPDAPAPQGPAAREEAARLAGAPDCCARAAAADPWARAGAPGWAAVALRAAGPEEAPASGNPLLLPGLAFRPCRPDCAAAGERLAGWARRLGVGAPDEDVVQVFPLDPAAPGELVALRLVAREPDGLRYEPAAITPGPGPLRARLREGDRLRLVPGQVQLWSGPRLVDVWSADVGLWDPRRRVDTAAWAALAAATLRRRDPQQRAAVDRAAALARAAAVDRAIRAASAAASAPAEPAAAPADPAVAGPAPVPFAPSAPDPQVALAQRPGTLRVTFLDRRAELPSMTFYVGAAEEGDPTVKRVGQVGLAHAPCPTGKAFQLCVRALEGALRAIPTPPNERNFLGWERIIHREVDRSPVGRRFHCAVDQL
jgi:hypothetical protein